MPPTRPALDYATIITIDFALTRYTSLVPAFPSYRCFEVSISLIYLAYSVLLATNGSMILRSFLISAYELFLERNKIDHRCSIVD